MSTLRLYNERDTDEMIHRLQRVAKEGFEISTLEICETILDEKTVEAIADLVTLKPFETVQLEPVWQFTRRENPNRAGLGHFTLPDSNGHESILQ